MARSPDELLGHPVDLNDDDVTAGQVMHAERQDRHEEVEMLRAAIAKMQVHARPFVGVYQSHFVRDVVNFWQ
jgi:hypothetical protein